VLFTFDDGYRTVFTLARPILERYTIPAVVLVCSDPVDQRRLLWYDAVARAHGEDEVERIKTLPFDEWEALQAAWSRPADEADPMAPLTVAEVRALAQTPGIEIGAHTAAHPILARGSVEQQCAQIARSKARLEDWIGRPVTAFAYPNGRPSQDYNADTVALVKGSGFETAFTSRTGFATPAKSPGMFALPHPRGDLRRRARPPAGVFLAALMARSASSLLAISPPARECSRPPMRWPVLDIACAS
jgi:peptidoglycan/xylan/chitin deacetylase (PgdA/CDA1 family)